MIITFMYKYDCSLTEAFQAMFSAGRRVLSSPPITNFRPPWPKTLLKNRNKKFDAMANVAFLTAIIQMLINCSACIFFMEKVKKTCSLDGAQIPPFLSLLNLAAHIIIETLAEILVSWQHCRQRNKTFG